MIDLHQPQWLAAPSSRGYSTIPEGKLIMSKDSKPTKKATVSKRRPMKKDTVSNDSKPAEESAVSNDSKPTKKATVSKRRPMKKDTVPNDSKPAEESAVSNDSKTVSNDSKPAEENAVSNDIKPTEKGAAGETPVFDFAKLMSQFRLPGVDFTAFVDRERKNIEALVKANRIAFEGLAAPRSSASRNAPGNDAESGCRC
jgi:hypothetical protein